MLPSDVLLTSPIIQGEGGASVSHFAEFGGVDEDVEWGNYLLDYLEDLEIGWAAWSYSDHPHLVTADARTTPFGELVRQRLADPTMESWNRS